MKKIYLLYFAKRFDKSENNVGILCTKLAVEASAVQGVIKNQNIKKK